MCVTERAAIGSLCATPSLITKASCSIHTCLNLSGLLDLSLVTSMTSWQEPLTHFFGRAELQFPGQVHGDEHGREGGQDHWAGRRAAHPVLARERIARRAARLHIPAVARRACAGLRTPRSWTAIGAPASLGCRGLLIRPFSNLIPWAAPSFAQTVMHQLIGCAESHYMQPMVSILRQAGIGAGKYLLTLLKVANAHCQVKP